MSTDTSEHTLLRAMTGWRLFFSFSTFARRFFFFGGDQRENRDRILFKTTVFD
jgi:hypothetical protein